MKVLARVATGLLLLHWIAPANGQTEEDILRFSFLQPGGSARSNAMAGAFGALGADPAAASINPAGLALYSTSEFSLTPSFEVQDAKATHYGTSSSNTDNRFFFNNLFLQFAARGSTGSKWTNYSFGLSYDRLTSFHWERQAIGENVNSTIAQRFVNEANGTPDYLLDSIFPFGAGLAWLAYAFDPLDSADNTYVSAIPVGSRVDQAHTISSSGNVHSTSLFFAASYMDELFIGGSIGIYGVRHERITTHKETSLDQSLALETLTYDENLLTTGSGFDLKLGAVVRAGEKARLGLAFHSPVWMQLSDGYVTEVRTTFRNDGSQFAEESPDGTFTYRGRTPLRIVASGALIVGKLGSFSVDYEFADYRHMRLKPSTGLIDAYDFSQENSIIRDHYRIAHHVRAGTEWRVGSKMYLRAGAGYWPDPYVKNDARHGLPLIRYTGGLGYRSTRWSVDFAGLYGSRTGNYFQYDPSLVDATNETLTEYKVFVTVAYRP